MPAIGRGRDAETTAGNRSGQYRLALKDDAGQPVQIVFLAGEAGVRVGVAGMVHGVFQAHTLHEWLAHPAGQLADGAVRFWVTDHRTVAIMVPGVTRVSIIGPEQLADLGRLLTACETS